LTAFRTFTLHTQNSNTTTMAQEAVSLRATTQLSVQKTLRSSWFDDEESYSETKFFFRPSSVCLSTRPLDLSTS